MLSILLTKSLQDAELESTDAKVVLVNHAYHPDEIDSIIYSHINDMVRDAHAAMVDMRGAAMPADRAQLHRLACRRNSGRTTKQWNCAS